MALKKYLVRAEGTCFYVAQVWAKSPKEALEHAQKEHGVLCWYLEEDNGFIHDLTDYENIRQDETTVIFD